MVDPPAETDELTVASVESTGGIENRLVVDNPSGEDQIPLEVDPEKRVERTYKTADQEQITEFYMKRLKGKFAAVAKPGFLYNSKGLLFVLMFAAGNEKGANAGVKIANDLMKGLGQKRPTGIPIP